MVACLTGGVYGGLAFRAAAVQVVDRRVAFLAAAAGVAMGAAVMARRLPVIWLGVAAGSVGGLQFFKCWPCDTSPLVMPVFGAAVGAAVVLSVRFFVREGTAFRGDGRA